MRRSRYKPVANICAQQVCRFAFQLLDHFRAPGEFRQRYDRANVFLVRKRVEMVKHLGRRGRLKIAGSSPDLPLKSPKNYILLHRMYKYETRILFL